MGELQRQIVEYNFYLQVEQQRRVEREKLRAEKDGVESLLIAPVPQDPTGSEGDCDGENKIVIQSKFMIYMNILI